MRLFQRIVSAILKPFKLFVISEEEIKEVIEESENIDAPQILETTDKILTAYSERELKSILFNIVRCSREYFQTVNQVIPESFRDNINAITNLMFASNTISHNFPSIIKMCKNREKFEENNRDMKILIGYIDKKIFNILKNKIKYNEFPVIINWNDLYETVVESFQKLDEKEDKEWLEKAKFQIYETFNTLKQYTDIPGEKGNFVRWLLSQSF